MVVRAPIHLSISEINDIVRKKSGWIYKTREKVKEYINFARERSFNIGEIFYLKGKKLILYSIKTGKKNIKLEENKIILFKKPYDDDIKKIFITWYKKQAKDFINERLIKYSNITGLHPSSVKITSANKRWGSCSGKDKINFSYKLIMTPIRIIDYVIVHELIHIKEKNHSKIFWQKVRAIIPDYKERRKWLRENGHKFYI